MLVYCILYVGLPFLKLHPTECEYSASEKTFRLINNTLTVVIFESNQAKLINNSRGKKTGKTAATAAAAQRCAWAWQLAMRPPLSSTCDGKWKMENEKRQTNTRQL